MSLLPIYSDIRPLRYVPEKEEILQFYTSLQENFLYGALGAALFPIVVLICNYFSTRLPRIRPGVFITIIGIIVMIPGAVLLGTPEYSSLGVMLSVNAFLDFYVGPLLILFGYDAKFLRWFE